MKSPVTMEAGKVAVPTYSGLDQNGQPYTAFSLQGQPSISDLNVLSWNPSWSNIAALGTGVGKSATVTMVFVDNHDSSQIVTKVETFNVVAPSSFLADVQVDWTIS